MVKYLDLICDECGKELGVCCEMDELNRMEELPFLYCFQCKPLDKRDDI